MQARAVSGYLASVMRASVAGAALEEQVLQLTRLVRHLERDWGEAERTRDFWAGLPRLASLRTPARRLILDSRVEPVSLSGHFR